MPHQWKPSVTVAAVVQHEGRFLLVEESTTDGIKLNQPAGHLDPGETPEAGALREALEESGWALQAIGLLGVYLSRYTSSRTQEDVTYLRFAFACRALHAIENAQLDEGIIRTLWLTPEEVKASKAQHRSPLVMQCIEDYLAWQRRERLLTPLDHVFTHSSVISGPLPAGQS
jgi:phosphatase NudJ